MHPRLRVIAPIVAAHLLAFSAHDGQDGPDELIILLVELLTSPPKFPTKLHFNVQLLGLLRDGVF